MQEYDDGEVYFGNNPSCLSPAHTQAQGPDLSKSFLRLVNTEKSYNPLRTIYYDAISINFLDCRMDILLYDHISQSGDAL